jgi:D-lactate dehydrogenase
VSAARNILRNTTSGICIKPGRIKQFYRENDPTNSMNPGIGKTTRKKYWKESADAEQRTQASD